jgi:hypothetical protein
MDTVATTAAGSGARLKILNNCIYFDIVARGLHEALGDLGIDSEVVDAVAPEDFVTDDDANSTDSAAGGGAATYVVFTTHHLHEPLPPSYISYNFEQLVTDKAWPDAFFARLRGARQVWDYSLENIRAMERRGGVAGAVHVPFGYCRHMDALPPGVAPGPTQWRYRPLDWLMLGSVGPHRAQKLAALAAASEAAGADRCLVTNDCWGRDWHAAHLRARVGLNIHYYTGRTILEVHRIIPMVANRVWVVSERSDDPWYDDAYAPLVTFLPRGCADPADVSRALAGAVRLVTDVMDVARVEAELERRRADLVERCSYRGYVEAALPAMQRLVPQLHPRPASPRPEAP